jgi:hypothetical protein
MFLTGTAADQAHLDLLKVLLYCSGLAAQQQDPIKTSTGSSRHHGLAIDLQGCQVLLWHCRCAAMGCLQAAGLIWGVLPLLSAAAAAKQGWVLDQAVT